ncbi:MAG: hypothetical protein WC841_01535 [Candidatus Shapirobacteria bacterium]|jgi:hypothetical protein
MSKIRLVLFFSTLFIIGFHLQFSAPSPQILQQTEQCFQDGQIPCRFLPNVNNGYGYPYFTRESPFPYYLSLVFRIFGLNYSLSLVISTVIVLAGTTYLLKKILFQKNHLLSILAPLGISLLFFYFSNVYFLLPFCLLIIFNTSNPFLTALMFALLIISSSKLTLVPLIVFIIIVLTLLFTQKKSFLLLSIFFGLLLSSFHLGPMLFDRLPPLSGLTFLKSYYLEPSVVYGRANISQYKKRTNFWRFTINVPANQSSVISVPIAYYDGWTVLLNQKKINPNNPVLLQPIELTIPPGNHTVAAFLEESKNHLFFNSLSIISFISIFIFTFPKHDPKNS